MFIPIKGVCKFHHLDSVRKQEGKAPPELEEWYGLQMPEIFDETWEIFQDLSRRRAYTESGPSSITYTEIDSYYRLNGMEISPLALDMVIKFDETFLSEYANKRKQQQ